MTTAILKKEIIRSSENVNEESFEELIEKSWKLIAPAWPLKNLNAVNPLQGFEDLAIEDAIKESTAYFQFKALPKPMESINRETIKWLQPYFDEGQATIPMPLKDKGLFAAWRALAVYDKQLHQNREEKVSYLKSLSNSPKEAIIKCLRLLKITAQKDILQFLKLALTTMPGWPSYIKYLAEWSESKVKEQNLFTKTEYLALRVVTIYLLWPKAKELLLWHQLQLKEAAQKKSPLKEIEENENKYRLPLLKQLTSQKFELKSPPSAQLVFCIDVRSEYFRRALESTGNYDTFGFAGFFGIPAQITDVITKESYSSCPVLLSPKHEIEESPHCSNPPHHKEIKRYERLTAIQKLYQSIKYNFSTPFALVEGLGIACGAWIGLRTLTPSLALKLKTVAKQWIQKRTDVVPSLKNISFKDQCVYAENALRMIGLTNHFAPLVVFCGHGSSTQNNAYATSLDCGACGGRHGASNARILAAILNCSHVRNHLAKLEIDIPKSTRFIGAEHNTTTDEVTLYSTEASDVTEKLKHDLEKAQHTNAAARVKKMNPSLKSLSSHQHVLRRSQDWAQVRPEWGLARNTSLIIAPRTLTQSIILDGRCFLHSYDHAQDIDGVLLESILTAPMVVAQWINTQYLFSTLDNVAYGGGSKVTCNITGKLGIMQGNASDLMTGLPLQSVYSKDTTPYHESQRLMTVVYAPRSRIDPIIQTQPVLQKLFGNGWVQLVCIEPESQEIYFLQRDFIWKEMN